MLHTLYDGGSYQFLYAAMVGDVNSSASHRLGSDLNLYGYPTCFYDGGAQVTVGGSSSQSTYTGPILTLSDDQVEDLFLEVSLEWLGSSQLGITARLADNSLTNEAPATPAMPSGATEVDLGEPVTFVASTTDLDGDQIWYQWCVDALCFDWYGPYNSGDTCQFTRSFGTAGDHNVQVKAKDNWVESAESDPLTVNVLQPLTGDANRDGVVNITDAVYIVTWIFAGGPGPDPELVADANCDQLANVTDAVYIVSWIFTGGPPPGDTDNDGTPDC